jgi:hypothetical protein
VLLPGHAWRFFKFVASQIKSEWSLQGRLLMIDDIFGWKKGEGVTLYAERTKKIQLDLYFC